MKGAKAVEVTAEDEDETQMSLAPYLQTYLANGGRGSDGSQRRLSSCLPSLFERASDTWWDPRFDSEVLEGQFWRSSFPQIRERFQLGLSYLCVGSLLWTCYFAFTQTPHWLVILPVLVTVIVMLIGALIISRSQHFQGHYQLVAAVVILSSCLLSLLFIIPETGEFAVDLTPVGLFSLCMELLLILYTVVPLRLHACVLIGVIYSVAFEVLTFYFTHPEPAEVVVRFVLHLCIHIIGIHILVMTTVRMRGTFVKVGQSLLVRQQLENEKQLKEKMILSLMPSKVAEWLLKEGHSEEDEAATVDDENGSILRKVSTPRSSNPGDIRSLFRPFNMHCMDNVSILFADIVGFTRMSSNKTAEQLVSLLNDLFERFDDLCARHGCEKISTLGDCYYCVSGCPLPRPDHAICCVEMGLSMIVAIQAFDRERNEDVNMRVGVHTGTVLCGIVGTRRFKFDVWSNDVTLANRMESTGQPGKVHISEATSKYLNDMYILKEAETVQDMKTYFIVSRKADLSPKRAGISPAPPNRSTLKATSLPSILDSEQEMDEEPLEEIKALTPQSLPEEGQEETSFWKWPIKSKSQEKLSDAKSPIAVSPSKIKRSENEVNASPVRQLKVPTTDDQISTSPSINSRKDSGIRSTSRRSSIQQQIYMMNGLAQNDMMGHRVSGYYTSSQDSVADPDGKYKIEDAEFQWNKIRKLSDLQMIRCVQEHSIDPNDACYFSKKPLNKLSLFFRDAPMESDYRTLAHCADTSKITAPNTLASARLNTYLDLIVALLVFIFIAIGLCALFGLRHTAFVVTLALGAVICISVGMWGAFRLICPKRPALCWYPWHIFGALVLSLPAIAVLANFHCNSLYSAHIVQPYCLLMLVGLVHFCNFTQLNCWMKSLLAAALGAFFITLVAHSPSCNLQNNFNSTTYNSTEDESGEQVLGSAELLFRKEVYVDVFLLLLLIVLLNREFEISFRLSFHGNALAAADKARVQATKNQVDWLLHNIIPRHVAEQLKSKAMYSENHHQVGILFASIVNFNEMYDESYLGGREYLRVLNELISDFDELLHKLEFKNVEKIKTIGSTYMAASGLNPKLRTANGHPHQHLFDLIEFARAMQKVVADFNKDLLEFKLILRIGYNHGDVTAGVIGTTKLYYDIWGDAVNIASRMDSTGVRERVQVGESCLSELNERYQFEPRGSIYVKGKDNMRVFLLKGEQDAAS
ncbi:adenylate cyclase type 9 isoform X2 [Neocloeon triangulifer]|uniref:adenylate cyclase type 9 isoform X2 n=1 Tax=Neocloeon triangulifer TaxID=2078957 RepID=UPI00286ECB7B|nr:adenylate cyclase type 9 isoform X2 [Neocloeon triangulifer]